MNRRDFLKRSGAALAAGPVLGAFPSCRAADTAPAPGARPAPPGPTGDGRPNILFCIGDDPSWRHFGAAGDRVCKTPAYDRIATEGVLFTHAFCASPSCTPSRGSILTGQEFYRLEQGGNLWSTLPARFDVYPDLLEKADYTVGLRGKGWGPGDIKPGGRTRNPAGPNFRDFDAFLATVPAGKPFCFWFGSQDPHRPYDKGSGAASGMKIGDVQVPPFLPDDPVVRSDILDYYFEIQRYDRDVGLMLDTLEKKGLLDNTLVVMTGDNGMPFPRCKANLYDGGTREPLAVRWPRKVPGGGVVDDFVSLMDVAPTLLEAAGIDPTKVPGLTARSFLDVLTGGKSGRVDPQRDRVFTGRERHANVRAGNVGYPCRALRTYDHLYIRNFAPQRWPAGDPQNFGDIDGGPTKTFLLNHRDDVNVKNLFELACAKRPAEELYDLKKDPWQMNNVAGKAENEQAQEVLRTQLEQRLTERGDPRAAGKGDVFDQYEYRGRRADPLTVQTQPAR